MPETKYALEFSNWLYRKQKTDRKIASKKLPRHHKPLGSNKVTEITIELNQAEKNHLRNCKKRIELKSCEVCNNIKDKTFYQLIESLVWADHAEH